MANWTMKSTSTFARWPFAHTHKLEKPTPTNKATTRRSNMEVPAAEQSSPSFVVLLTKTISNVSTRGFGGNRPLIVCVCVCLCACVADVLLVWPAFCCVLAEVPVVYGRHHTMGDPTLGLLRRFPAAFHGPHRLGPGGVQCGAVRFSVVVLLAVHCVCPFFSFRCEPFRTTTATKQSDTHTHTHTHVESLSPPPRCAVCLYSAWCHVAGMVHCCVCTGHLPAEPAACVPDAQI